MGEREYLCIDLKSYYASVECVERGLDPLTARLVVADPERTEKTICLAVSPALKALGVPGRCRVFEIPKGLDYIMAPPRMSLYLRYSARIYGIYLRYVAPEDIHVYSVDEAFLDVTAYHRARGMNVEEFARAIMAEVLAETGITASCGIGSNLYLAKIAMDILAKKSDDHLAALTEERYRSLLWDHRPITDFWMVAGGTARRLESVGIRSMRGVAEADEALLYRLFGVNARFLIDHAWGRESTTMADIKAFRPATHSLSRGQVLTRDYGYEEGRIIVREMAEDLALEMFSKGLQTESVALNLGYAMHSLCRPVGGSVTLAEPTDSVRRLIETAEQLYDRLMDPNAPIRRLTVGYGKLSLLEEDTQFSLFGDSAVRQRERRLTGAVLQIRDKYGKNGIFKGTNLLEGATGLERNRQIGGHRA